MANNRSVTRVGRQPYATRSHLAKPVKTPGGRLHSQKIVKKTKGPRCSDCKCSLPGIKHLKKSVYQNLKKRERTVSRAYGGSACANCVKTRVMRAFLLEEHKAVKKLLAERGSK
eukprot:CAMPEP_0116024374 /NCGR_PEP_ID=MMETSP0321-20121206/12272_1 /TAXON_ID=163516 /ORGANISM="Leptocylindrus danicus var. danicus, Strain B650" /LENGTH=113 /DNA_ID=CAMNT_0003496079 /DNA_START=218 /DNA_END=559 /DNA_ORIENTATION=-